MPDTTLSDGISELVNAIGGQTAPSLAGIKSKLMDFLILAQTLEDGNSVFETTLEKAALQAEVDNLKTALDEANAEIQRFKAEQAQRTKEYETRDPLEERTLLILKRDSGRQVFQISEFLGIGDDLTAAILERLKGDNMVNRKVVPFPEGRIDWFRSAKGNEYLARRGLLE